MKAKKIDKYLNLARELKDWNMGMTVILIVIGALGTVSKENVEKLEIRRNWKSGGIGNQEKNRNHPDYVENSEKSSGDQ